MSTFPQNWVVPGTSLGPNIQSGVTWPINSAGFDMDISFYGPSGGVLGVLVELKGTLSGTFTENASGSGFSGTITGTPSTAVLLGGLPGSGGVPLALIDQYLNTANYAISGSIEGPNNQLFYSVTVDPSPEVSTPEPSTLAVFAALGIAAVMHRRRRRS
jgi:hypothetical protein